MRASRIVVLIMFATLALTGSIHSRRFDPMDYAGGRSRDAADRIARNSSAVAAMLGELRATAADLLFLKTERYLDSGVAFQPHAAERIGSLEVETAAIDGHAAEAASGPHDEHDGHAGTPTMIPTADRDFRGFIGRLEREVKPWRDPSLPHQHTPGTELLPWYRVMTLADPNDVRAYAIASWWLQTENIDEGVRFLREGIRNNPGAFQLHHMMGRLLAQKSYNLLREGGDAREAAALQRDAIANEVRAAELGFAARPAGWTAENAPRDWTVYTEDDFRAAIRLAVLLEFRHGDSSTAAERARAYIARIGGDLTLQRLLERETKPAAP